MGVQVQNRCVDTHTHTHTHTLFLYTGGCSSLIGLRKWPEVFFHLSVALAMNSKHKQEALLIRCNATQLCMRLVGWAGRGHRLLLTPEGYEGRSLRVRQTVN